MVKEGQLAACFIVPELLEELVCHVSGKPQHVDFDQKQFCFIDYRTHGQTGETIINHHEKFEQVQSEW